MRETLESIATEAGHAILAVYDSERFCALQKVQGAWPVADETVVFAFQLKDVDA